MAQDWCVLWWRLPSSQKLYTLRGVSAVYDDCNVNPEFTEYSFLALLVRPGETGVVCRMSILNRTNTSGYALRLRG